MGKKELLNKIKAKIMYTYQFLKLKKSQKELVIQIGKQDASRYKDLAPNDELETTSEYFKALSWAFNNQDVYNIALTGPYGSGKSSIIKSYIKKHPELKYISISLANFVEVDSEGNLKLVGAGNSKLEDKLEADILKQLFYKVEHKRIPQSRYRKLYKIGKMKIFLSVISAIVITILCLAFKIPKMWGTFDSLIKNASENLRLSKLLIYIIGCFIIVILIYLISALIRFILTRVKIQEVSIADKGTATIGVTEENSIFNKNMDEIVYFFEATKYNVVFIEDLDRFESTSIFIKLRELNTILNNYEAIKKRVVFVYAVKDDMFSSEDRTKFFEFIIPVIPIMNCTNSGEILLRKLKEDSELYADVDLPMDYITLVAPYINDMRVLSNIYNEFITYKRTLQMKQELKLSDQLMFSMMIFKNLYPKDYAALQAENGIIKEAFQLKKVFAANKKVELEKERDEIADLIESAEQDALEDIKEVKSAMLLYMTDYRGLLEEFRINYSTAITFEQIMEDSFELAKLRTNGTIYYRYLNGNRDGCNFDGNSQFVDSKDYIKRCKAILTNIPEQKENYRRQIESINDEIHRISALTLKEIIKEYGAETVLSANVRTNKLLTFLLRQGFIDEKYPNYINYFHANSITKDDMNFILSIRDGEAEEFTYQISQTEQVVKRLLSHEFEQREIYNFDLMDFLISSDTCNEKCGLFLKQLSDENEISWKFINEYFDKAQDVGKFMSLLCNNWSSIWDYISANPILSEERKEKYFNSICTWASIEDIERLNMKGNVKKYFEVKADILYILRDVPIERSKETIKKCDVKFSVLNVEGIDVELLNWIFDKGYYENTLPIIQSIFKYKASEDVDKLLSSNYSAVVELGYAPLLEHIDKEFEKYVEDIVLAIPTNTEENLEAVLAIIEKGVSREHVIRLIQKENVVLDSLDKCSFDRLHESKELLIVIWDEWIKCKKLKATWENVILYWNERGVSTMFMPFLEENIDEIVLEECPQDIQPAMIQEIIQSNMENICFRKFIEVVPKVESVVFLEEISQEHMSILIKEEYFSFDQELAMKIKEVHPGLYAMAIIINKAYVMENIEEYTLDKETLEEIVNSEKINENEKIYFITHSELEGYTRKLALFLRETTLELSKTVFQKAWMQLRETERYELFLNQVSILSNAEISEYLERFGEIYQGLADRGRRHEERLYDTSYNRKLVKHLEKIKYITSYFEDEKEKEDIITHEKSIEKFLVCRVKKKE